MRWVMISLLIAACGGRAAPLPTLPRAPTVAPARDLAAVHPPAHPDDASASSKVVDLDIIRITAREVAPGGDREVESVATADLFREAGAANKDGQTERAIGLYRRIVAEFPDSKYAPVSLWDIAAIYDARRDLPATISALRELVKTFPQTRESVQAHLYIAALQADHDQLGDAIATLDEALARPQLTYADRVEAFARRGYCLVELHRYDEADRALAAAVDAWHQAPRLDDPYYIAMAFYERGEVAHRRFVDAPVRPGDDQLVADLDHKRALAATAYDLWKEALGFQHAYWATASGYQMSQIFVELWETTVKAPYPGNVAAGARGAYITRVHDDVRSDLEKALDGHRANVELAKAFGVETSWSRGSARRAAQLLELLADDSAGRYVTPDTSTPVAAAR